MRAALPAALAAAATFAACAHVPSEQPERIGRIYSYVRSDRDGGQAEQVHVFRAGRDAIQVYKMRSRCTNAALVTAELDLERGQAMRLVGGRLLPGAERQEFAFLDWNAEAGRIEARIEIPGNPIALTAGVPDTPWHVYDFDLADLTILNQYRPNRRADFSFGLPLIWPDAGPGGDMLRYLGRADARFVGEERHGGRRAYRFEVGGPAFGDRGGPLWFDAAEGHVLGAEFGIPNHSEHSDFMLRLTGVSDGGEEAWRRLLTGHFEGCPAG